MENNEQQQALTPWKWVPADQPLARKQVVVATPRSPQSPPWLLSGFLIALLGVAAPLGWLLWTWKQEEAAARQQALLHQHERELQWQAAQQRQIETMQNLIRQIETGSATTTAQPEPMPPPNPLPSTPQPLVVTTDSIVAAQSIRPEAQPERVKMELKSDAEPAGTENAPKRKRGVAKFLTSSIFVDSAVLTTSLLVPASLPLTMAQSRLGRRLTGRILKKTNTDKTVGAKVIRDVEDMPITQRRRR